MLLLLSTQIASAQCSNCDHNMTSNSPNPSVSNGQTVCVNASRTIEGFGNMAHTLCIAPGTIVNTQNYNPSNVTINVYGTLNMSNNFESNVTVNVFNGGTLNFNGNFNGDPNSGQRIINISAGGTMQLSNNSNYQNTVFNNSGLLKFNSNGNINMGTINNNAGGTLQLPGGIDKGTINNSGTMEFTSTGNVYIQNANSTINNLAGGQFIATAPSLVVFNPNTFFHNAGTANFKSLENQDGTITNAAGANMNVSRGFYSHGAYLNNGTLTISCNSISGTSCGDACLRFQNKGANKQFVNNATVNVNGSVSVCGGVIVHNNGTINISGSLSVTDNNSGWAQNNNGYTNVTGSTTNTGSFTGGTLCTQSVTGTVTSTLSCGTPPTIGNATISTCQTVTGSVSVAATITGNATIVWGSLQLKVGTTTITANGSPTSIIVANVGTYNISYNNTSATISFVPDANFTGSNTATYRIASISGSTTTYSDYKNVNISVSARPAQPTSVINAAQ